MVSCSFLRSSFLLRILDRTLDHRICNKGVNLDWHFFKRGPLKGSLSIDENRQKNRRRELITEVN
jgi:hypothetical protein